MDPLNISSLSRTVPAQQEPIPTPPGAEDVQEFQKLYWNEGPDNVDVDPMLKLAMNVEIDPVSQTAFSRVMEKIMEGTNKADEMRESIIDRLRAGGIVSAEERAEFMTAWHEASFTLHMFGHVTKKSEEGLKALMTGQ